MTALPIVMLPHPIGEADEGRIAQKGVDAAAECVRLLTSAGRRGSAPNTRRRNFRCPSTPSPAADARRIHCVSRRKDISMLDRPDLKAARHGAPGFAWRRSTITSTPKAGPTACRSFRRRRSGSSRCSPACRWRDPDDGHRPRAAGHGRRDAAQHRGQRGDGGVPAGLSAGRRRRRLGGAGEALRPRPSADHDACRRAARHRQRPDHQGDRSQLRQRRVRSRLARQRHHRPRAAARAGQSRRRRPGARSTSASTPIPASTPTASPSTRPPIRGSRCMSSAASGRTTASSPWSMPKPRTA